MAPWRWEHLSQTNRRAFRALVDPIVTAALNATPTAHPGGQGAGQAGGER